MEEYGLQDLWRLCHGEDRKYTRFIKKGRIRARLDFFIVNNGLVSKIISTDE